MTDFVAPETKPQDVADVVRARMAAALACSVDEIEPTSRVTELPGMDSAKLVEVVVWCETRWQVQLNEELLFDARTCQDLCEIVAEAVAAKQN